MILTTAFDSSRRLSVASTTSIDSNDQARHYNGRRALGQARGGFDEFARNLKLLEESLTTCSAAKDRAIEILDRFEEKFEKMEQDMNQMNETIDVLKLTYDNIDKTISTVDNVVAKYNLPKEVEKRINRGVDKDLASFMQALDQRDHVDQFFTRNNKFRTARDILSRLSDIKQIAIQKLENEFSRILKEEAYSINPNKLRKPIEEGIDIFPNEALENLNKIASRLNSMAAVEYREVYVKNREAAIRDIIARIYPDAKKKVDMIDVKQNVKQGVKLVTHNVKTGVKDVTQNVTRGVKEVTQNVKTGMKDPIVKKPMDHMKSSGKFIQYMTFYLELLKSERDLAQRIIFGQQTGQIFAEAIQSSLTAFMERAELLTERNHTNERIFTLLDILDVFNGNFKIEFKILLADTVLADKIMKLSDTFQDNISKTLIMYIKEIKDNEIEVFPDGAVHQATTNAIGFLKKLYDYDSVDGILALIYKGKRGDDINNKQKYTNEILNSVDLNIVNKSKLYKNMNLATIFVLNNHYYVYVRLQEPKFKKLVSQKDIQKYQQWFEDDAKRYIQLTWSKALANFSDPDNKIHVDKKGKYKRQAKKELKKRLSNFNDTFLDVYHTQRSYSLYNLELKEKVRRMTIEHVIPKYTQFVDQYCKIPFTRKPSKYLSYDSVTMQDMMLKLFDEEREEVNTIRNEEEDDDR